MKLNPKDSLRAVQYYLFFILFFIKMISVEIIQSKICCSSLNSEKGLNASNFCLNV